MKIRPKKIVLDKEDRKKVSYKNLLPYFKGFKKYGFAMAFLALLLVGNAVLSVISPIYAAKLITLITSNFNAKLIIHYASILLVFGLISSAIGFTMNIVWVKMGVNVSYDMHTDMVKHINSVSVYSYDLTGSNTISLRLFSDLNKLSYMPMNLLRQITSILGKVGFLTYLFTLNIWVAIYLIGGMVIITMIDLLKDNMRQRHNKFLRKCSENISNMQTENIRAVRDIRGLNVDANISSIISDKVGERDSYSLYNAHNVSVINFFANIFHHVYDFCSVVLCVWLVLNGQIELTAFIIAYNFRGNIMSLGTRVVDLIKMLNEYSLNAERLNEIMDQSKYPVEKFGNVTLDNCQGRLTFDNVSFSYDDKTKVLDGISFDIKPNTIVSFVGMSGAGKSTIVNLVSKLYELKSDCGQILLDDVNINKLTKSSLRDNVCIVSQTPYLFNMTIAENLRLANPDATDEQLTEALKSANIWDFVNDLPDKMDSKLGEGGIKVSGGQRQRLAIARALLKNSKVILFDEATSALDNANQALVKEAINKLREHHTIVMVAHRLSTVVDSDNIIFIQNGKVLAQGTHKWLMRNCSEYKNLYAQEDINESSNAKG